MNAVAAQALSAVGVIVGVLLVAVIGYAANNFAKWTGIQLSAQQRQIIDDAANAIANALKLMIAQGKMLPGDFNLASHRVQAVVGEHITPDVQEALAARHEGVVDLTRKAMSKVGNDHTAVALLIAPRRTGTGVQP